MSTSTENLRSWPTEGEVQAAMRVGRRLRAEAFAEFFGFGAAKVAKPATAATGSRPVTSDTPTIEAGGRAAHAGC